MTVLMTFPGVRVRRVLDRSNAEVEEHAHDWPLISLYVIGGYRNVTDLGECAIGGPSMVFYRRGAAHRNMAGEAGFEQIEIEFDPVWLGPAALPSQEVLIRVAGSCGTLARALAMQCAAGVAESELRASLRRLLMLALIQPADLVRAWSERVTQSLRADPARRVADLAHEAGRSAAWIGPAYRKLTGEGLKEVAARFRVERAVQQLRETNHRLSAIALEAGFSDQSHMNRTFRHVLGRLPTAVRDDREFFRVTSARPGQSGGG